MLGTARAQGAPTLDDRLDSATAVEVTRLADSARAVGLPAAPLIDKALEGATKHAPGARIVDAVRGLASRLARARSALGPDAPDADLVAAAGALYEGVSSADLARLRTVRAGRAMALPLVVLGDLIERGVPPRTATDVVLDVARTGAGDEAYTALRRDVEHDIRAGAPPAIAAATRARGVIYAHPGAGAAAATVGTAASGPTHHP
jgi:hypothetical protein